MSIMSIFHTHSYSSIQQHNLQTPELKQKLQALLVDVVSEPKTSGPQSSLSPHNQGTVLAELAELSKKQGYLDLVIECANKMPSDPKV